MQKMSAWVVLPTYNESLNIVRMLDSVFAVLPTITNFNVHVTVVDSKSPDGTAKLVKDYATAHALKGKLHLLIEERRGLGQAYDTGFAYARKHGADVLVEMDADMSHDPTVLPQLLNGIEEGNDLVIGSRYVSGGFIPGEWPLMRIINSKVARWVARRIGGVSSKVYDPTAGYRAIRASALSNLGFAAAGATGYVIQVKMTDAFSRAGFAIKEVPISFSDRQFGESKIRFKDVRQFVWFCAKLRMQKSEQVIVSEVQQIEQTIEQEEQQLVDVLDAEVSYDASR